MTTLSKKQHNEEKDPVIRFNKPRSQQSRDAQFVCKVCNERKPMSKFPFIPRYKICFDYM